MSDKEKKQISQRSRKIIFFKKIPFLFLFFLSFPPCSSSSSSQTLGSCVVVHIFDCRIVCASYYRSLVVRDPPTPMNRSLMSSTSKANRGLTHGGVKRSQKRNKNLRKKMGEERDKNIRHPRPAHVVMALFCSPNSQLSRDFFSFRRLKFFKSKINSTAISNGQSPFLAREI
jgi:hypothetical protein